MTWTNKYPDGCLSCGTTTRKHLGRGLCTKCYQNADIRNEYPTKKETDEMETEITKTHVPGNDSEYPSNGDFDGTDYSFDSEQLEEEIDSDYDSERRPGGFSSVSSGPAPKEKPTEKIKGLFNKAKAKATRQEAPPSSNERRPKVGRSTRRNSSAETLSDLWGGIGSLAIRANHAPLGRCLQFQAPVAGEMLDDAMKGTIVDKAVLQPIARGRGRFDALGAVFGPPLIVLAIERNPERAPVLIPMLKSSIRSSLPLMVPAIKKVKEREAKAEQVARDLFPDLPEGADPVDEIINMMFADWIPTQPQPAPAPQEETEPVAT